MRVLSKLGKLIVKGGKLLTTGGDITSKLELQEVKPNGNIVLTDGKNSKEYMAATPSGDPMHYAYVAAGAEYNATGADIVKTAPWGDQVTHKAGYWYLNGLGDLTMEEIRKIYGLRYILNINGASLSNAAVGIRNVRTYFKPENSLIYNPISLIASFYDSDVVSVNVGDIQLSSLSNSFMFARKLKYVYGINARNMTATFSYAARESTLLEIFNVKNLGVSINFSPNGLLKNSSILYIITNAGTAAFTITLHADAYTRAMADPDIQAALAAKPNVSLASA